MSQFRTPRRRSKRNLDERRRSEADIKYRHYVRPYGNRGLHIVKSSVDGREFTVSGPGRTFQPGTVVPTGSNTGTQGEFIVTDPPPGRRGAGNYAPTTITKRACPQSLTGRSYIGITDSGTTDIVQAWKYLDGTPLSLLDTASLPASLQTSGDLREHWELVTPAKIAFIAKDTSGDYTVAIWSIGGSVGTSSFSTGDPLSKLFYTNGALWTTKEEFGGEQYTVQRMNPVIGAGVTEVADISASTIAGTDLVIIAGVPWIRSNTLSEPVGQDIRYCGDGVDNFGPFLQDLIGETWGGHPLDAGVSIIGGTTAILVAGDQKETELWPGGWGGFGAFIGKLRMPLSTKQEYMCDSITATKQFIRLPIKDYSGIADGNCPAPALPISAVPDFQALLPL